MLKKKSKKKRWSNMKKRSKKTRRLHCTKQGYAFTHAHKRLHGIASCARTSTIGCPIM